MIYTFFVIFKFRCGYHSLFPLLYTENIQHWSYILFVLNFQHTFIKDTHTLLKYETLQYIEPARRAYYSIVLPFAEQKQRTCTNSPRQETVLIILLKVQQHFPTELCDKFSSTCGCIYVYTFTQCTYEMKIFYHGNCSTRFEWVALRCIVHKPHATTKFSNTTPYMRKNFLWNCAYSKRLFTFSFCIYTEQGFVFIVMRCAM